MTPTPQPLTAEEPPYPPRPVPQPLTDAEIEAFKLFANRVEFQRHGNMDGSVSCKSIDPERLWLTISSLEAKIAGLRGAFVARGPSGQVRDKTEDWERRQAPERKPVSPAPSGGAMNAAEFADAAISWLNELPDRTSPDDWPEACLVTGDELHGYLVEQLQEFLTSDRAATEARVRQECAKVADEYVTDGLMTERCGARAVAAAIRAGDKA